MIGAVDRHACCGERLDHRGVEARSGELDAAAVGGGLGLGVGLVGNCDIVIAVEGVRFGLPEVDNGALVVVDVEDVDTDAVVATS